MNRRLAAVAGLVALFCAVGAGSAAHAATYPPGDNAVVIGGGTDVVVGEAVDVSASVFKASSDVTFTVSTPSGAIGSLRGGAALVVAAAECETGGSCVAAADSNGVATASITFTQPGQTTVTATGTGADGAALTVTATVDVADEDAAAADDPAADDGDDNGGLAATGTDLIKYGLIGIGLVAIGALIVVSVRRRSSHTTA